MRRWAYLVALAVMTAMPAAALDVQILGPDDAPLAGARITVVGRSGSVVADRMGRATLAPDPELPFVLFIARPDGVALAPVTITEEGGAPPLVVRAAATAAEVTVVSGVIPDLELPPAVATTVIGLADLRQRLPADLPQVLENVPGADQTGEGHAAVPGLRGLSKHRTLILLDDGRVSAERRAGPSATFLDPLTIEEVEVVRGPGTVAYGSDALGGIIRMRSRMPTPGSPDELRWGLVAGTVADERGAVASYSTSTPVGGVLVGGHYREFADYESPRGRVPSSGARLLGGRLGWQAELAGGVLWAGWRSDLARDVGKPSPDADVERVLYPEENSHRLSLGFEHPGAGRWNRISASASWDRYRLVLDKKALDDRGAVRRVASSQVDSSDYGLRLEGERPLGGARLVLGLQAYGRYGLEALNRTSDFGPAGELEGAVTEISVADARKDDLGVFAALHRDWERWGLAAGLRGDRVEATNRGGYFGDDSAVNGALSGFAAVSFRPRPRVELTAQVARGFRDALLSDRYYRGVTGRGFITGNPALEPETSRQLDVAAHWRGERFQLSAYGYLYRIINLIERYKEDGDYFFRNRGEAEIRGVEVEGQVAVGGAVSLGVGAQLIRGEVLDDSSPTDDVPAPGVFLILRSDPSRPWWWLLRGAVFGRDGRPGPSEQVVPAHGVLDAGVGWRLREGVRVELWGRNLSDRAYLASADEAAVLAPGRALEVAIRGRI